MCPSVKIQFSISDKSSLRQHIPCHRARNIRTRFQKIFLKGPLGYGQEITTRTLWSQENLSIFVTSKRMTFTTHSSCEAGLVRGTEGITNCGMRIVECGMKDRKEREQLRNADCGMRNERPKRKGAIAECGLRNERRSVEDPGEVYRERLRPDKKTSPSGKGNDKP